MKYRKDLKFGSPEEMQKLIDLYFEDCIEEKEVPTVTGLCVYLDTDRNTLLRYEKNDEKDWLKGFDEDVKAEFRRTIKKAKARIESGYEQALFQQGKTVGAIFTLKNNYNYVDKTEQVVEQKEINIGLSDDE